MPTISKFMHNGVEYCLDASGIKTGYIDLLVVGGGGAGQPYNSNGQPGGGGGGGYFYQVGYPIQNSCLQYCVNVGCGGGYINTNSCNGCNSNFDVISAGGGGHGNNGNTNGANGNSGTACGQGGGAGCCRTGGSGYHKGGDGGGSGGGGGGAGQDGYSGSNGSLGGLGVSNSITGVAHWYAEGGNGNGATSTSCRCEVFCGKGGRTVSNDCNGKNGIVVVRYKTDGSCGILPTSTGGTRYNCGEYTIHCFTTVGSTQLFIPRFK